MKLKNLNLFSKLLLVVLLFSYACNKHSEYQENDVRSVEILKNEIKHFLLAERLKSSQQDSNIIDSISNVIDYSSIKSEMVNGKRILTIGFTNESILEENASLKKVLFYLKDNKIESALIVKLTSNSHKRFLSENFLEISYLKNKSFIGEIELFSLKNKFIAAYGVENYKLLYVKSLSFKSLKSNRNNVRSIDHDLVCTEWYLVTTYYYSDNTQEETRVYLYTTCESGGGGEYGVPGSSTEIIINNPCKQVDSLKNDTSFIAKMKNLRDSTISANEKGFFMKRNSNGTYSYSPFTGIKGNSFIDIDIAALTSPISGYIHSHFTGLYSIFSGSDIRTIYDLYNANKIDNINNFFIGLVTSSTAYILKVTDPVAFQQFGNKYFSNDVSFQLFEYIYSNAYYISEHNPASQNEANFINLLKTSNSGLKLFSGTNTFDAWTLKGIDASNNLINATCN
ncbi:hypothetical protein [Polluticaenibacter yanchengensis]|uniref:Lipoprotein n=1 Tax=Polluticaenibacter yanchengensis TaxID=3014562 RepID=A0ABT4UM82_9BACT|nr:hypothetical protein [Chitinophagaceae bacterium LY-5]